MVKAELNELLSRWRTSFLAVSLCHALEGNTQTYEQTNKQTNKQKREREGERERERENDREKETPLQGLASFGDTGMYAQVFESCESGGDGRVCKKHLTQSLAASPSLAQLLQFPTWVGKQEQER